MTTDRFTTRGGRTRQRPRTISVSVSPGDRGQTTQDFAVGIGVFILAVAFVFSFLPSIVTPYDSSVGGAETAQADRIADRALEVLSTGAKPNELEQSELTASKWDDEDKLAETFGLRTADDENILIDRMNVRVEEPDTGDLGDPDWTFGSDYDDQAAASSARIVTVDDGTDDAYRLVVRVW